MFSRRSLWQFLAGSAVVTTTAPFAVCDVNETGTFLKPDLPPPDRIGLPDLYRVCEHLAQFAAARISKQITPRSVALNDCAMRGDTVSHDGRLFQLTHHVCGSVLVRNAHLLSNRKHAETYFNLPVTAIVNEVTVKAGPHPIISARLPEPIPYTGAIGAHYCDDTVTVRVIASYDPQLGQLFTIDMLYEPLAE
jgi:hypothetical protein